jgi:SPX domain protein involved in polyphosphate accumulation
MSEINIQQTQGQFESATQIRMRAKKVLSFVKGMKETDNKFIESARAVKADELVMNIEKFYSTIEDFLSNINIKRIKR